MESILEKYKIYAIYLLVILTGFSGCFSCNSSQLASRNSRRIDTLAVQVADLRKTLSQQVYTKPELDTRLEILGLETSRRTLYDWNAVVRTTERPDDIMNGYDKQIKDLQEKLGK
jgi:hypothetical protein